LTNPAMPKAQVIGVYNKSALPLMTVAIQKSDPQRRALLLHGVTGWDEATPCCDFLMHHTSGKIEFRNAEHFGIKTCEEHELKGGSPAENARIAINVLKGEQGPPREAVLLNALLGYMVYFPKAALEEAKNKITTAIDSGAAMNVVQRLREKFPGEDE
jgi:anthranilate phosphoribosyltransferase